MKFQAKKIRVLIATICLLLASPAVQAREKAKRIPKWPQENSMHNLSAKYPLPGYSDPRGGSDYAVTITAEEYRSAILRTSLTVSSAGEH
jgi:hypothetical protein